MRKTISIGMLATALILASAAVRAQSVPELLSYQGRLLDSLSQPLNGETVDLTFTFYGALTGGTAYYAVLQEDVPVTGGIYNVLIGSGTATPGTEATLSDVFKNHAEVWMGIQVNLDSEMAPRSRIASTGYAMSAGHAQSTDAGAMLESLYSAISEAGYDTDTDGHSTIFAGGDDCNDGDSVVYSGALEVCDSKDNQCPGDAGSGFVDENCAPPPWPQSVGGRPFSEVYGLWPRGDYVYVAAESGGLQVLDVSDPTHPTEVGGYNTPGEAFGVYIKGDYAYVADNEEGLTILDISNPIDPTLEGNYDLLGYSKDVSIQGDKAYVINGRLEILDVSDPLIPVSSAYQTVDGLAVGVAVRGAYAYVGSWQDNDPMPNKAHLTVIDISGSTPSQVGEYETEGEYERLVLNGEHAYIATDTGMHILNVSTPSAPYFVGKYENTFGSHSVYVSGKYAYLGTHEEGLQILNITDPESPVLVGTFEENHSIYAVAVDGNYAYTGVQSDGVLLVEVMK